MPISCNPKPNVGIRQLARMSRSGITISPKETQINTRSKQKDTKSLQRSAFIIKNVYTNQLPWGKFHQVQWA